jgi:hypothetical protein
MYRIRRFGVIKTANIVALIYVLVILIFIVPFAVLVLAASPRNVAAASTAGVLALGLFGVVFYGAFGWIFAAVACLLYNFAARYVGGIEVQVEPVAPPTAGPVWGPPASAPPPPVWGPPTTPPAPPLPPAE